MPRKRKPKAKPVPKRPPHNARALRHIHPDLRRLAVHVDQLHENPQNAREHDPDSVTKLAYSYATFGQRKPIVARLEGMQLEAGHGTLLAFRQLGFEWVACVVADDDEAMARAFGLADNRTAELSTWTPQTLAEEIEALEGFEAAELGFDQEAYDALLDEIAQDDEELDDDPDVAIEIEDDPGGAGEPEQASQKRLSFPFEDPEDHLYATQTLGSVMNELDLQDFTQALLAICRSYNGE